jgi:hypothetical protein
MEWIYSAVIVAILSGLFGLTVGGLVLRRVLKTGERPRMVITWLLGAMTALALVQVAEQSRVLIFRLSYDGYIDRAVFGTVYGAAWNVTSTKILAAVALTIAAAVKLGLYLDLPEQAIVRWGAASGCAALAVWVALAVILDGWLP